MPEGWIPTRRFPVVQHDKLRPIDDLTECGTNGACSTLDKLDLRALDETVFTAMLIMRCLESRCFALRLDDGRVLRGRVHPYWLQHPDRARVLVKTVDLKSAYKQLALHPDDRRFSVISLKDPADDEPKGFLCRVLPFGSIASVGHFNRVARLVQRIFHEMKLLAANYFDDYPLLEVAELSKLIGVPSLFLIFLVLRGPRTRTRPSPLARIFLVSGWPPLRLVLLLSRFRISHRELQTFAVLSTRWFPTAS